MAIKLASAMSRLGTETAFEVLARARQLEARGVEFHGETRDSSVCHMAFFSDPDGNALLLHRRYAPPR